MLQIDHIYEFLYQTIFCDCEIQYLKNNYFPAISDASILEIRRERGIELAFEGFRFYDIVRWKRGELMDQTWNGFYVPALNVPIGIFFAPPALPI